MPLRPPHATAPVLFFESEKRCMFVDKSGNLSNLLEVENEVSMKALESQVKSLRMRNLLDASSRKFRLQRAWNCWFPKPHDNIQICTWMWFRESRNYDQYTIFIIVDKILH